MQSIQKNVADIPAEDRPAVERLLGLSLSEDQRLTIQVANSNGAAAEGRAPASGRWNIPACFAVLTDLTADERRDFDASISQPMVFSYEP